MPKLYLTELLMLREEISIALDNISKCGLDLDINFAHVDFQRNRYKRLVHLYEKLDECILDMLDALDMSDALADLTE